MANKPSLTSDWFTSAECHWHLWKMSGGLGHQRPSLPDKLPLTLSMWQQYCDVVLDEDSGLL